MQRVPQPVGGQILVICAVSTALDQRRFASVWDSLDTPSQNDLVPSHGQSGQAMHRLVDFARDTSCVLSRRGGE